MIHLLRCCWLVALPLCGCTAAGYAALTTVGGIAAQVFRVGEGLEGLLSLRRSAPPAGVCSVPVAAGPAAPDGGAVNGGSNDRRP